MSIPDNKYCPECIFFEGIEWNDIVEYRNLPSDIKDIVDKATCVYVNNCPTPNSNAICGCGSEKLYGNSGLHSHWCPKYKDIR